MAAGEFSVHRKLSSLGEAKPGYDIAHAVMMLFDTAEYNYVPQDRIDLSTITIQIHAGHVIVKAKLQER